MLKVMRRLPLVCALALFAAPLGAQRRPITPAEIEKAGAIIRTAYDAVSALRPRWLEAPHEMTQAPSGDRAAGKVAEVHVYVDGRDLGRVDYLKTIPIDRVGEIRWLSTNEAGASFGPSEGPVIAVALKRP